MNDQNLPRGISRLTFCKSLSTREEKAQCIGRSRGVGGSLHEQKETNTTTCGELHAEQLQETLNCVTPHFLVYICIDICISWGTR